NVAEAVKRGGERGIDLQIRFQHGARAVVILLEVEPFGGHIENVLVAGVALQEIVHAGDGGEKVVVLDAGHPAGKELFVGSGVRKKRFGFGKGEAIRHDPAGGEGEHGEGEGGLRIHLGGAARQSCGVAVDGVFIIVDSELERVTGLLGMCGEWNGAEKLLSDARYARGAATGAVGSSRNASRRSLRPGSGCKESREN